MFPASRVLTRDYMNRQQTINKKSLSAVFIVLSALFYFNTAHAQEEFNGPLPGWANVKTRFNAKGNGKEDDTKFIQRAIDSLTQPAINYNTGKTAYMVIYLPAGVYNISSTLLLKGKIGVSIIGESPLSTIIKWTGADGGNMLLANGTAYFKISRVSWDANKRKNIEALGIHWKSREKDEKSESAAPTSIEISDNVFTGDCKYGISGGTAAGSGMNAMDAEITIRRCLFNACETGIQITGYNALDYWVWDCRFLHCSFGIRCNSGNYHVYRSYFSNCYSDVENTNSYYTSLRGCYSENATHLSYDQGASSNPFKRIFQANTVITPKEIPIISYHLGKITLLDNLFDSAASKSVTSFVETGSWAGGNYEVLSVNNRYRNTSAVKFNRPASRLFAFEDKNGVPIPKNSGSFLDAQDKLPPLVKRQIFLVPAGAGTSLIQGLIDQALQLKGNRPIVYFPVGKFMLDVPLHIDANADVQLIGSGYLYASMLQPSAAFPKGMALINIKGPTQVTIKDIQLGDFTSALAGITGIRFANIDQPEGRAFIDQLYSNATRSVYANGLDYLRIQESNSFFSDGKTITGGPLLQKGEGTASLYCFGSQFAGLRVDKNAVAVIKDCWWEGAMRKPLSLTGSGRLTIDGAMIAPNGADSNTTVSIEKFSGKISLLNMYLQGAISVDKNSGGLNLLLWNIHFYFAMNPLKFITSDAGFRTAALGLTTQCFTPGDKKCDNIFTIPDTVKGNIKIDNFFPEMLADDRAAMPRKFAKAPSAVSAVVISRVSIGGCATAIEFSK
jgi:hypothetical protein